MIRDAAMSSSALVIFAVDLTVAIRRLTREAGLPSGYASLSSAGGVTCFLMLVLGDLRVGDRFGGSSVTSSCPSLVSNCAGTR